MMQVNQYNISQANLHVPAIVILREMFNGMGYPGFAEKGPWIPAR